MEESGRDSQWFKEALDFFSFVPEENISIIKFLEFQCQLLKFNFMFCSNYYEGEKTIFICLCKRKLEVAAKDLLCADLTD